MNIRLQDDMISYISNFLSTSIKMQLELPLNKHDYEMCIGVSGRLKHKSTYSPSDFTRRMHRKFMFLNANYTVGF